MRKWLFQKVNRADSGRAFALLREMNRGQNNGARIRVTGAEIVEKFLPQIVGGINIENEKIRPLADHDLLRFFEAVREIDLRVRCGFAKRGEDGRRQLLVRRENEDSAINVVHKL